MADLSPWARAYILINYPSLGWAIDHPELGPILSEAVAKGWDEPTIVARVKQTTWYRSTTDAQRQWELLRNDNPGEAAKMLSGGVSTTQQIASRLGISLTGDQALWIGTYAVANGWTEAQIISNMITNYAHINTYQGAGSLGGQLGSFQDQAMARAKEWGVPMSDAASFEWSKQMATGFIDQQGLDAYLRDQAASRFPTLKPMYDMGFTTRQIFDPYIQQTAQLMETSPSMIDFTDPKWLPMVDSIADDGTRRPMSLSEAGRYVRGQTEWRQTQQAGETAARTAETIMQKFGAVA